jgi:hypothetical protein
MRALLVAIAIVTAAAPAPEKAFINVLPRLSLRGSGCHRELLAADGGRICGAVVLDEGARACATHAGWIRTPDGGTEFVTQRFGSGCLPPGPRFASLGRGFYFVEGKSGSAFTVLCDDAPSGSLNWENLRLECSWTPDGGKGRHAPALPPGDYNYEPDVDWP